MFFSFETLGQDVFLNYNQKYSSSWQFEYKQIFQKIDLKEDKIRVTDKYGQPYIFALFYLKFPPKEFRETVNYNPPDKWGFSTVSSFANFEFRP